MASLAFTGGVDRDFTTAITYNEVTLAIPSNGIYEISIGNVKSTSTVTKVLGVT